jgi:pimeloyl-ACP methyl ester carboxylesterase
MSLPEDIVILHGALGARVQFEPLAEVLASHFRVHTLDFEGHGGEPPRERPLRVQHLADNVRDFLKARDVSRAGFFGYSMGGYVALYFAIHHANLVDRIATLGTKFRWNAETAAREAARLDPVAIRAKVPRFAESLAVRHGRAGGWESVLARTAEFLQDLGANPLLTDATLAQVRQPVRIIVGDRDNTVSVDESSQVANMFRAGSLTILEETPHPIEQVQVGRLASVLRSFFAGLPSDSDG